MSLAATLHGVWDVLSHRQSRYEPAIEPGISRFHGVWQVLYRRLPYPEHEKNRAVPTDIESQMHDPSPPPVESRDHIPSPPAIERDTAENQDQNQNQVDQPHPQPDDDTDSNPQTTASSDSTSSDSTDSTILRHSTLTIALHTLRTRLTTTPHPRLRRLLRRLLDPLAFFLLDLPALLAVDLVRMAESARAAAPHELSARRKGYWLGGAKRQVVYLVLAGGLAMAAVWFLLWFFDNGYACPYICPGQDGETVPVYDLGVGEVGEVVDVE